MAAEWAGHKHSRLLIRTCGAESDMSDLVSELGLCESETATLRDNVGAIRQPAAVTRAAQGGLAISRRQQLNLTVWVLAARGLHPNWSLTPARGPETDTKETAVSAYVRLRCGAASRQFATPVIPESAVPEWGQVRCARNSVK